MSLSILLVSIFPIRLRAVFHREPEWYFLQIGKENILPDCSLEKWCGRKTNLLRANETRLQCILLIHCLVKCSCYKRTISEPGEPTHLLGVKPMPLVSPAFAELCSISS